MSLVCRRPRRPCCCGRPTAANVVELWRAREEREYLAPRRSSMHRPVLVPIIGLLPTALLRVAIAIGGKLRAPAYLWKTDAKFRDRRRPARRTGCCRATIWMRTAAAIRA